jgi:hypothetical protein
MRSVRSTLRGSPASHRLSHQSWPSLTSAVAWAMEPVLDETEGPHSPSGVSNS